MNYIPVLVAVTDLSTALGKLAGLLNSISMLLFFGAMIFTGYSASMGRVDGLKQGIIGAGVGALAWAITKTLFQMGGTVDPGIELQGF
jgi:hypothetical protein